MSDKIKYDSKQLKSILDEISDKKLIVPNFQREIVWERLDQKKLIASCLARIPIGSILILKANKKSYSAKFLGFKDPITSNKKIPYQECEYLLDGQQRLASLYSTFFDLFDNTKDSENDKIHESLYDKLRNRWFLSIKSPDFSEDIWGYNSLSFDPKNALESEPKVLESFIQYERNLKTTTNPYSIYTRKKEVNAIVTYFANELKIPLYLVYDSYKKKNGLLTKILRRIAHNRVGELQTEYGGVESKKAKKLLEPYYSSEIQNPWPSAWASLQENWISVLNDYFDEILENDIPTIHLPENEVARATVIFENLNRGGTPLSTFDLVVAKVFDQQQKLSLRDILKDIISKNENIPASIINRNISWDGTSIQAIDSKQEIANTVKDQFLNILSILVHEKKLNNINNINVQHIKKKTILELNPEIIRKNTEISIRAIKRALIFLQFRCGVIGINDIIYELMILPISYLLKDDSLWLDEEVINKLEYWYWLSLFTGRYREQQNERCIEDIKEISDWILHDSEEVEQRLNTDSARFKNILNIPGYADLDLLLQKNQDEDIPNAVKKALLQYILSNRPKNLDYQSKYKQNLEAWSIGMGSQDIETHHIIPLANVKNLDQSTKNLRSDKQHILNSPLNLTYLLKETNRRYRDFSPSDYLTKITDDFNNLPLYDHAIPTDKNLFKQIKSNITKPKLKKFSKIRFQEFKRKIEEELNQLIS